MENKPAPTDAPPKRIRFFRLSPALRLGIYLPVLGLVFFFGLRRMETKFTYAPVGYAPGPEWNLPAGSEEVWFAGPNGQRLHGRWTRAHTQPAVATILYCHGNGGNVTYYQESADGMAARGFDVLLFDYRGYGRSEGEITDEWGLYADSDAAYDYLTRGRGVSAQRLVFYGQSLGTAVAIDLASRRRGAALVVEMGLSSASAMGETLLPWLPRVLHRLGKNRFESARKLANVSGPVLVTHGAQDSLIPVAQGRALYEAAREPKRLLIVPQANHDLPSSGGSAYLDSVADFLRQAMTVHSK